jgi:hypothetical protein
MNQSLNLKRYIMIKVIKVTMICGNALLGFDFISKYDDEEEERKSEESTFVQEKIPKGPTTIGTSKSSPYYLG